MRSKDVQKHERLIGEIARKLAGHPDEDLVQVGRIALWESSKVFDPARGAALWTFARKAVYGAMYSERARQLKHSPARELLPADNPVGQGVGVLPTNHLRGSISAVGEWSEKQTEFVDSKVDHKRLLLKAIRFHSSPVQRWGVRLWLKYGYRLREISKLTKRSQASICRDIRDAFEQLRQAA